MKNPALWLIAALTGAASSAAEPLLDAQVTTPSAAASLQKDRSFNAPHRHEWGLGFSGGAQTHPADTYWVEPALGVANPEIRLFPNPDRDLAMVIQGNWTHLLLSAVAHAPAKGSVTLLAQGHPVGWDHDGRVALTMAAGGTLTAMSYDNPIDTFGHSAADDEVFVLGAAASVRLGVDLRSHKSPTRHGLYLRPEAGLIGQPDDGPFDWMGQFAVVGEYVVTWAMGRR